MKESSRKSKIAYGVAAVLLFGLLFAATYPPLARSLGGDALGETEEEVELSEDYIPKDSYYMVVLGDSILGQIHNYSSVPARIGDALGKNVFNGAFGGSSVARQTTELGNTKDCLSTISLVEAAIAGDFGVQQMIRTEESATEDFPFIIDALDQIDFSRVEILLIGGGVNDYHAGIPISSADPYDEYTYTGALRSAVTKLRKAYPKMRIILSTATYTWYPDKGLTCEEYDCGGGLLEEYVNAELALAQELDVEIVDLYHDVYAHDTWEEWKNYTYDGLHPSEQGRFLLAQILTDYLKEQPSP